MAHEKAKFAISSLNDFVAKEYVKTKTIEETFQLVDEIQSLERQLATVNTQKADMQNERAPIEKEIAELQQRIAELETKGPIEQLNTVEAEKEALTNELKNELRHLQKPFIKVQALATQGGGAGLTPDELKALNGYMETPAEALAAEEPGYPTLRAVLEKLTRLMSEDKLKLKADKARKASQSADEILKRDSLIGLQARSKNVVTRRTEILASTRMDEIKRDLSLCQEQLKQLTARKTNVESHEGVKENEKTDIQDKIRSNKRAIEKNVNTFLGKKIEIQ
jgi:chromosome segregation ATPase